MSDWVRLVIAGTDNQPVSIRVLEDAWYQFGGYYHPGQREEARMTIATAELQDWLHNVDPPTGAYMLCVSAVDTGQVWARVRVRHSRAADLATTHHRAVA